jgi:hypothetical protein
MSNVTKNILFAQLYNFLQFKINLKHRLFQQLYRFITYSCNTIDIINYPLLLYSYNFNPIKNTHLRYVTVHYFSRIVQPEAVFFPYWTSKYGFFRIVHYVREVTRWFLSSASKLFLIAIYNQINLFDI